MWEAATMTDTTSGSTPEGTPRTLVGISFGDTYRAQEFLTATSRLASQQRLKLVDAVFVTKDENGRTMVRETTDPGPGRSALSGAVWASLFGLILGGPVGWVVGGAVGAGTGAVAAKIIDHGVSDEWVAWFRESVATGTTTLALLVEGLDPAALVNELERFAGARLVYANLDPLWLDRMRSALGEPPAPVAPTPAPAPADAPPADEAPGDTSAGGEPPPPVSPA
jgi:uncharacterized membrane protein